MIEVFNRNPADEEVTLRVSGQQAAWLAEAGVEVLRRETPINGHMLVSYYVRTTLAKLIAACK